MTIKTIREVLAETIAAEMRTDPDVFLMGEDVSGGAGCDGEDDAFGGAFGQYKGLVKEFGRERIIDTPITESAFIGAAGGAAATGMRPIVDLMFVDFIGVCFDQIFNQMAKFRYMFGGKSQAPLVILGDGRRRLESRCTAFADATSHAHRGPRAQGCHALECL